MAAPLMNKKSNNMLQEVTTGVIAIDNGGSYTKVLNHTMTQVERFHSRQIPVFDLGIAGETFNSKFDFEVEWNGESFYVGRIAERETNALPIKGFTDSKSTDFFILNALIAIHQYGFDENYVVIDIPIEQYKISIERQNVQQRLEGKHTLKINGNTKSFSVKSVAVMAECINAFWVDQPYGTTRWLDLGSRTINFATLKREGTEVDAIESESGTLPFGLEKINIRNYATFAKSLEGQLGQYNWKKDDEIYIVGGGALINNGVIADELRQRFPNSVVVDDPQGIQARGMLLLGVLDIFVELGLKAAIMEEEEAIAE